MKKPNKRALMIKGSKWEATQDFDVMVYLFSIQKTTKAEATVPSMSIKKGTVFTILGKGEMGLRRDDSGQVKQYISMPVSLPEKDVVLHPMPAQQPFYGKKYTTTPLIKKDAIFVLVPFDSFAPYVEQEGEAKEQYEYVIRDKATGKYYRTTNDNHFKYVISPEYTAWSQKYNEASGQGTNFNMAKAKKWKEENPPPITGWYVPVESEPSFHMEDKMAKAKKHPDLGKVKTTIFNFTGYYSGLDDFGPNSPEWMGDNSEEARYSWDLPETFEAVKIGKFSKEEIETYDLQTWYKNALRLRTLTKTYGTSVREVFKKFEEKNLGGEYVVNFRTVEGRADNYTNKPIEPTDLQEIEDHIREIGVKPMAKAKGVFCYSVLVGSVSDAVATRMVGDKFVVSVIDTKTMQEMVE